MYGLVQPGDTGLPGCGDQAGEYPGERPVVSLAAAGEKDGPPGVIPLPTPGVHAPYGDIDGVAPEAQGVWAGVIPEDGDDAPKIPPPIIMPCPGMGISIPNLHLASSNTKSNEPEPILGSCPNIMFSETPRIGSTSAQDAASISTSTDSSNEHFISAPVSCLLIP